MTPKLSQSLIPLSLLITSILYTSVHGAPIPSSLTSEDTSANTPRLTGRPGWNPLWGLGPVIPPAGSLDRLAVNNDPQTDVSDTNNSTSNSDSDPPENLDSDSDSDPGSDSDQNASQNASLDTIDNSARVSPEEEEGYDADLD